MNYKSKLTRISAAIIFINAAGILLRHFNLDTYIIIAGFRFHLSLMFPLFFIITEEHLQEIKKIFINPLYNKTFQPLAWIFLPLIIILSILYFAKKIEIGDPEYFYEFGLSSIVDYPLYLIWNIIQLFSFGIFLILTASFFKQRFIYSVIIIILLYAYEFIPIDNTKVNLSSIVILVLSAVAISLLLNYFQNIYWFTIILFTIFWSNLLAIGSESNTLIHILFAARYSGWDGFFEIPKGIVNYLLPAQLGVTILMLLFSLRKKSAVK